MPPAGNGRTPLGDRFIVRMTTAGEKRARFVERRGFVSPWPFQAALFESAEAAENVRAKLKPGEGRHADRGDLGQGLARRSCPGRRSRTTSA